MSQRQRLALKRKALEISHLEAWLTQGRGGFHLENIEPLAVMLEHGLRLTGQLARGQANALNIRVRPLELALPNLPLAFDGLRVLFLSDLHIDALPDLGAAIARAAWPVQADLCLLGGDYRLRVKGACHNAYHHLGKLLQGLHPPLGVHAVLGNHDFAEEAEALAEMGVNMLINQAHELRRQGQSLWLVGLDDPHFYGCDDLASAMAPVPDGACSLLLVHTPELYQEASRAGCTLYLCGHTHAGQIRLPGLGALITNAACPRHLISGLWRWGEMWGYTSSGAGSSMVPVRFNCPPEVVRLTLRRGQGPPRWAA